MYYKFSVLFIFLSAILTGELNGQELRIDKFLVETEDGLYLPAQVIEPVTNNGIVVLFINGSTPYDEQGNLGAIWNDRGESVPTPHAIYRRFIDILPRKGYTIVTLAKRSFVYPTKIPRPSFENLTNDIFEFINVMKQRKIIADEKELVIIGYSEGSAVTAKLLPKLNNLPFACVLLGSADLRLPCESLDIEEFYQTDFLRKKKKWSDEQIEQELSERCKINNELSKLDELTYETTYKKSNPYGFGFADWESIHINKEWGIYDPLPNLLSTEVPLLICIGENDSAMPVMLAKKTFNRLVENQYSQVSFRLIDGDNHQYEKYDVFPIIDKWLASGFTTTEFTLNDTDRMIVESYARNDKLFKEIESIPYGGGYPDKILRCYKEALNTTIENPGIWFSLGIKLVADEYNAEAFNAFSRATDDSFVVNFASYVWLGHLKDLVEKREEAIIFYKKALQNYPGFPVQHDNWDMFIDKNYIEERIKTPFMGIHQTNKK